VCEHFNGGNVATHALAQITWTVAADFVKVVYTDGVSSMVSDNIVDALAKELDAVAFDQFPGFLMHDIWSRITWVYADSPYLVLGPAHP
jgi:hypothetical protein